MIKRLIAPLIVSTGILLPASVFAAKPVVTWRNCMRLVPPTPARPTPIEPDVDGGGPFHAPGPTNVEAIVKALTPPQRPRQWINASQHAEVYTDAAGVLRYDPATVASGVSGAPCLTGNCPR